MVNWRDMELTIEDFHKALESKVMTVEDLVTYYLGRIEAFDQSGPKINSVICINPHAISESKKLDERFEQSGLTGPLHGVPVILKDNVETEGLETTAGSLSLKGYIPDGDAYIVQKLKAAGAIVLAKANLHEFAIWGETISSILGQTLNPYDLSRTPGGSSGGTGAALASNFGMVGIGTDTINSVRSPASANSIVGIRPTVGLVSRAGIVPYSYTQDTAGPMARTVADAVKVLDVISGFDPDDDSTAWSVGRKQESLNAALKPDGLKGKRIGVLATFFGDKDVHQDTNEAVRQAIDIMKGEGAEIVSFIEDFDSEVLVSDVSVHLHDLKDHLNDYLMHLGPKVSVHSIADILASGAHHPGIKENLLKASSLSTDADLYNKRLILREKVRSRFMLLMATYQLDAVVYPHQKQLVCKVGDSQTERNGVLASVTGFPSICVPAGYSRIMQEAPLGVPIGMEIMGRPFSESTLIEIAYGYEQASQVRKSPMSVQTLSINTQT